MQLLYMKYLYEKGGNMSRIKITDLKHNVKISRETLKKRLADLQCQYWMGMGNYWIILEFSIQA